MNSHDLTKQVVIDPNKVDLADSSFLVPCFEPLEPLIRSVKVAGLLHPPLVQTNGSGKLVPIFGRRRLQAAVSAGLQEVKVTLAAGELTQSAGFLLAFWDNIGHRRLDVAMVSFLTARLCELFPLDHVTAEFLPVLGVQARGPRLERLRAIGALELHILAALAQGRLLEKTAYLLAGLDPSDRSLLTDLVETLRFNANTTAEVLENLTDLSVFNERPLGDLVADGAAREILDSTELPVPERASRFRELVRSWKYPELTTKEREFRDWLGAMSLPEKFSVRPARAFEDQRCTIEIRADSREEARQLLKRVLS